MNILGTRYVRWLAIAAIVVCIGAPSTFAQQVGECVRLHATNPAGVPRHRESHNSFSGERFPDGFVGKVQELASGGAWLKIDVGTAGGTAPWIAKAYVAAVVPCDQGGGNGGTGGVTPEMDHITVGTWNLEWLKDGKARGFPEYIDDEAFGPRTDEDYTTIAGHILSLQIQILVLEEVSATVVHTEMGDVAKSPELDRLVDRLNGGAGGAGAAASPRFHWIAGKTGTSQHVAMIYDTQAVHLQWSCEGSMPNPHFDGASLFAREPLLGYFKVFSNGVEKNDLIVVGVHLASGQQHVKNHDRAMQELENWLDTERAANGCIPTNEHDIIITGDFNASRFDGSVEMFWDRMEAGPWDVLADFTAPASPVTNQTSYPATRLSGHPPHQDKSRIDYMIISKGPRALAGLEITATMATVHSEIVGTGPDAGFLFRQHCSDHLPVTVDVKVQDDDD